MSNTRQPRIPSYRRHRPSGQAIVTLDGKDFYLGAWNSGVSKTEYDRVIAEWMANGRHLPRAGIPLNALTINELIVDYWQHARQYYRKDGTATSEIGSIQQAFRALHQLCGAQPAAHFGPLALKAVREVMIKDDLARGTINRNINRVKRLFKWATQNELIPPAVYQGLQTVAGLKRGRSSARETDRVKPVPIQSVDAIQSYVSRQVWAMIELQRITGMRSGEVVIMRRRDLDTTGPIWLYRPESHKTQHYGHERNVELVVRCSWFAGVVDRF